MKTDICTCLLNIFSNNYINQAPHYSKNGILSLFLMLFVNHFLFTLGAFFNLMHKVNVVTEYILPDNQHVCIINWLLTFNRAHINKSMRDNAD